MTSIPSLEPGIHIITGSAKSGKSHLLRYLMHECRKTFTSGIAFSPCAKVTGELDFIDPAHVHSDYDEAVLMTWLEEQASSPSFCIVDDATCWGSVQLRRLASLARGLAVTFIVLTQYFPSVPPVIRNNAINIFAFDARGSSAVKALFMATHHGIGAESFKSFIAEATSEPYNFMWFNGKSLGLARCPTVIPNFTV